MLYLVHYVKLYKLYEFHNNIIRTIIAYNLCFNFIGIVIKDNNILLNYNNMRSVKKYLTYNKIK